MLLFFTWTEKKNIWKYVSSSNLFIFVSCQHHNFNNQPTCLQWIRCASIFLFLSHSLTHSITLFNNICLQHSIRFYLQSKTNDRNIYIFSLVAFKHEWWWSEKKGIKVSDKRVAEWNKRGKKLNWCKDIKKWMRRWKIAQFLFLFFAFCIRWNTRVLTVRLTMCKEK